MRSEPIPGLRQAVLSALMKHLYVWAPGEEEARRVIEEMANEIAREVERTERGEVSAQDGFLGHAAEAGGSSIIT